MKLLALVPVHTHFPVAGLSIGSFLKEHRDHEIDLHVGIHTNYSHYTQDTTLFDELRGVATIHKVDEIDWLGEYNECFYRYSVMNAKNVENLIKKTVDRKFDYAVLLDHDIHVKTDFVRKCVERYPAADLIGAMFDDKEAIWQFTTNSGMKVNCLPKVSAWHMVMSRRLFQMLAEKPSLIYPKLFSGPDRAVFTEGLAGLEDLPVFADTFAQALHACQRAGMKIGLIKTEEFAGWVKHFFSSSFNYGQRTRADYPAHIAEIEKIYREEFPYGLIAYRKGETSVADVHRNLLQALTMVAEQHATIMMNDTVELPLNVRDREIERLNVALMTAKAMCVTAGIPDEMVRTFTEIVFQKEKRAWESMILARGK